MDVKFYRCSVCGQLIAVVKPTGVPVVCCGKPMEKVVAGSTDAAAEKEFRRMDLVREKCRGCAFLPMCTPFSHCPEEDTHCKDVERMFLLYVLRRSLDLKEEKNEEAVIQGELS